MTTRARKENESFKKYRAHLKAEARLEKKRPMHKHTDGKVRMIPYMAKLARRTLARGRG